MIEATFEVLCNTALKIVKVGWVNQPLHATY